MIPRLILLVLFQVSAGISQKELAAGTSANREQLAVLPFEVRGLTTHQGFQLTHRFAEALGESMRFNILPATAVESAIEGSGVKDIDSCNSLPCVAQWGKVLGAEKVVRVGVTLREQRYVVHIQLVRSSDAALLYDERVDHSGDFETLSTVVVPEQGRKLSAAFLDKKPSWVIIGAAMLVGVGLIFWLFTTFGSMESSVPRSKQPTGPPQ